MGIQCLPASSPSLVKSRMAEVCVAEAGLLPNVSRGEMYPARDTFPQDTRMYNVSAEMRHVRTGHAEGAEGLTNVSQRVVDAGSTIPTRGQV